MTCDLAKFEEYLRNRHYSSFTVRSSKNFAIRLLNEFTEDEIISTNARDLVDGLSSESTYRSKRIYKARAALFKEYLTQGVRE